MAPRYRLTAHYLGRLSELTVNLWYRAQGYRVRDSNWRTRGGELDLVLSKDHKIVFVEVRGRRGCGLVSALESFDERKRYHFERCALYYLHRHGLMAANARMDFAGVTWIGLRPRIEVIKNVTRFDD
jgi:putative endonuclease